MIIKFLVEEFINLQKNKGPYEVPDKLIIATK